MTVHDLAADWAWMGRSVGFKLAPRGRVVWESAEYGTRGGYTSRGVLIQRLDHDAAGNLVRRKRYVAPDTRVTLIAKEA